MRRGPKPRPTTNPTLKEGGVPRCPGHLDAAARTEWRRLARPLFDAGILTVADRAAFAAYCQSYSQWAEAVRKQRETPKLIKTPSGYVQQSPWIGIANKQLELMGRYMGELGITPTARSRVAAYAEADAVPDRITRIEFVSVYTDDNGQRIETPMNRDQGPNLARPANSERIVQEIEIDGNL